MCDQGYYSKNLGTQIKMIEGFTKNYNVDKLVDYEKFDDPISAIAREKQLKDGSRKKS